jgi:hypothetical protein
MALSKQFYSFLQMFREKLAINRDELELECQNQPLIYEEIGQEVTKAYRLSKDAKADYDCIVGSTMLAIRKNPGAYGLDKLTESTVNAAVTTDEQVKKSKAEMHQKEEEFKALQILQEACQQRKSSIRDLVDMWVHNYYSSQTLSSPSNRVNSTDDLPNSSVDEAIIIARQNRKIETQEEKTKER